jgi:hypothetical protein
LVAVVAAHMPLHLTVFPAVLVAVAVTMPPVALGVPARAAKDMLAALAILSTMQAAAVVALLL